MGGNIVYHAVMTFCSHTNLVLHPSTVVEGGEHRLVVRMSTTDKKITLLSTEVRTIISCQSYFANMIRSSVTRSETQRKLN